jgi:hypothetical protein
MEPRIDQTQFGSVTIDGEVFTHDVIIRLGGQVEKRKKKLSKAAYGTSHTIAAQSLHSPRHAGALLCASIGWVVRPDPVHVRPWAPSVKLRPVCVGRRLAVLCGGESGDLERPAPLDGVWPP